MGRLPFAMANRRPAGPYMTFILSGDFNVAS